MGDTPAPVSAREQEFAASALLEALAPDAPVGFAVHDEELRFVLISGSLAAMNGRPATEHLGRRVSEIVPGELGREVEALIAGVRDGGGSCSGLELAGTTDAAPGEHRSWLAGYHPLEHAGRRMVGVVLVETTSRKRAERALRDSERLLSGAQRMAGVGWWTWEAEPDRAVYSRELVELMGLDPALGELPLHEERLMEVRPEDEQRLHDEALAAVRERRPFACRIQARRADGSMRVLESRAEPVTDDEGRVVGLRGFAQDITELERAGARQRAVAELGQAALGGLPLDDLLRLAVESAADTLWLDGCAVLELAPDGRELLVRAARAPAGYEGPWTVPVEPGSLSDHALRTGQPVVVDDWTQETRLAGAEATRRAGTRSSAAVVIGGRERPYGLLCAHSADPGRFDQDSAVFLQGIANVLAEAAERRLAGREIAELSASRGRLVASALDAEGRARRLISEALHDGPLQDLLATGHDLHALTGRGGDDAAVTSVRERLAEVVHRLRDVMGALHPTVLQYGGLEAALRAVADQHERDGGFACELSVDPAAVGVRDDLLLSIARELLGNAARHAAAHHVVVDLRRVGHVIVLGVDDDGTGIAPGRAAAALAEGRVGLASCRERVEAVGGRLTIESESRAGARILVEVPQVRRRVFIADDHAGYREGIAQLVVDHPALELVGQAADGEEALAGIAALEPDVALLDVRMPGLSGIEVCRRLAARATAPRTRVVLITGTPDPVLSAQAAAAGAAALLGKETPPGEISAHLLAVAEDWRPR